MFKSQKPSSFDLPTSRRLSKKIPGFNCAVSVSYNALCSEAPRGVGHRRVKRPVQIYAFPEGSKDESATFVNTLKVFQSAMSVW